ncbi:helix-turn-helix domain-containing protein [Salinactinospora qingdaonensis]|uniref:Helix-turn-helix transcriptional regulator n=1 Tax=Salinactinospora qingdaonensis TaxID=702744 RepID=A0ABP7FJD5_9ACTN
MRGSSDPIRQRHLVNQLKRLRTEADMSQEAVAEEMGWDRSKIVRIESGKVLTVKASDVRALGDLYGLGPERKAALVELAKRARTPGWWHRYEDVLPDAYVALEEDASYISNYEPLCVPGLLQTEEYTAALTWAAGETEETTVQRRAEARANRRQTLLNQNKPPKLWLVIDEAVLLREVGGRETMRGQLQRILELGGLPNINVQVLPLARGAHAAMGGPFVLLEFPASSPIVYLENDISGLYMETEVEITRYRLVFDLIQDKALSTDDSVSYLEKHLSRLSD